MNEPVDRWQTCLPSFPPPSIVSPIEHCDTIDFLLFLCLEDFPEENTDCQYDANFLDHSSVNMNEILCLDVGGDKYRDGDE